MPRPTPPRHRSADRTRRLEELLRIARQLDLDATLAAVAADEAGWMARLTAEVEDRQHKAAKAAAWAAALADRQAAALAQVGGWDGFARRVVALGMIDEDGAGPRDAESAARLWAEMDAARSTTGMTGPECLLATATTPERNDLDPWLDPWAQLRSDARKALDALASQRTGELVALIAGRGDEAIDATAVRGLPPTGDQIPQVRWDQRGLGDDESGIVEATWGGVTGRYQRRVTVECSTVVDYDAAPGPGRRHEVSGWARRVVITHLDGGDPAADRERVVTSAAALRDEARRANWAQVGGLAERWVARLVNSGEVRIGAFRRDRLTAGLVSHARDEVWRAMEASAAAGGPSLGEVASRALGRDMSSLDG